jgi:hypothetical protein
MNRRQFFTVTSCLAAAGCGRTGSGSVPSDLERARKNRETHLAALENYRMQAGATRTTPKPAVDIPAVVPELKALSRVTVRLHPRYGDEPRPDESKLGGRFLWPADEPWPNRDDIPLVPVLQLRAEDGPPNVLFRPGTDLLQLLWGPRAELEPVVAWRKRAAVTGSLVPYPDTAAANMDFVPVPCRVFPERVTEYPSSGVLPAAVTAKIDSAKDLTRERYDKLFAAAHGTKVGGYPRWPGTADPPVCTTCGWGMEYLLTVAGKEWDDRNRARWMPKEEVDAKNDSGFRSAAGLNIGSVLIFVCRRCEHWPIGYRVV